MPDSPSGMARTASSGPTLSLIAKRLGRSLAATRDASGRLTGTLRHESDTLH